MGFFSQNKRRGDGWVAPKGRTQRASLSGLDDHEDDEASITPEDAPAPAPRASGLAWGSALKIGGGIAIVSFLIGKKLGERTGKLAGAHATLAEVRRQLEEKRARSADMTMAQDDPEPVEPDADTSTNGVSVADVLADVDDNDPKKWMM